MARRDDRRRLDRALGDGREWVARIGHGAMEKVGKRLARELAKRMPGGNVIYAAVAASLTGALGEAYIPVCTEALRRRAAGEPMSDGEAGDLFAETYSGLTRPRRPASRT